MKFTLTKKDVDEILRACPFCGGRARLRAHKDFPDLRRVMCCKCKMNTGYYQGSGFYSAIKRWNRRPKIYLREIGDTEGRIT